VFFRYQPDEATITVLAIGAQSLGGA
jgi:hypothetical protein